MAECSPLTITEWLTSLPRQVLDGTMISRADALRLLRLPLITAMRCWPQPMNCAGHIPATGLKPAPSSMLKAAAAVKTAVFAPSQPITRQLFRTTRS